MRPDPKPRKRIVGSQGWWRKQQRAKTGRCSLCRRTAKTSWHHLVERSLGGDDLEVNLLELCGGGTTGCHGDVTQRLNEARTRIRRILNAQQMGYIIERKGRDWLERHYPDEGATRARNQDRTGDGRDDRVATARRGGNRVQAH